jgi:hypothetical protein
MLSSYDGHANFQRWSCFLQMVVVLLTDGGHASFFMNGLVVALAWAEQNLQLGYIVSEGYHLQ